MEYFRTKKKLPFVGSSLISGHESNGIVFRYKVTSNEWHSGASEKARPMHKPRYDYIIF